jgi:hypothetical protein
MAIIVGPSDWWVNTSESINPLAIACSVGTRLPDGSTLICKFGGTAWIVAPCCTQVFSQWAGGQYNNVCTTAPIPTGLGKNISCLSEWSALNVLMIQCGFNPSEWFVPSSSILNNPGYICRNNWDQFSLTTYYWSSSENGSSNANNQSFCNGSIYGSDSKSSCVFVRAFRTVTY